jgi:ribosomal protein L24
MVLFLRQPIISARLCIETVVVNHSFTTLFLTLEFMSTLSFKQWVTVTGGMHKGKYGYILHLHPVKCGVYLGEVNWSVITTQADLEALWTETYLIERRFLEQRWLLEEGTRVEIIKGIHRARYGMITKMNRVKHQVLLDSEGDAGTESKYFSRSFMIPWFTPDPSTADDSTIYTQESYPSNHS